MSTSAILFYFSIKAVVCFLFPCWVCLFFCSNGQDFENVRLTGVLNQIRNIHKIQMILDIFHWIYFKFHPHKLTHDHDFALAEYYDKLFETLSKLWTSAVGTLIENKSQPTNLSLNLIILTKTSSFRISLQTYIKIFWPNYYVYHIVNQ
jgi:hypothetical protein